MSAFEAFETIFYDEIQIISGYDEHYKQKTQSLRGWQMMKRN